MDESAPSLQLVYFEDGFKESLKKSILISLQLINRYEMLVIKPSIKSNEYTP